jgi:hypothetical protein
MREHRVPTIVVHGEKDLAVPFESARDMPERADGALYHVPGAYRSWTLANPRQGVDLMRRLLAAELGEALRADRRADGASASAQCWADALLSDDSPLRTLNEHTLDVLGTEVPQRNTLNRLREGLHHAWREGTKAPGTPRIWDRLRLLAQKRVSAQRADRPSPPPPRRARCCAAEPRRRCRPVACRRCRAAARSARRTAPTRSRPVDGPWRSAHPRD